MPDNMSQPPAPNSAPVVSNVLPFPDRYEKPLTSADMFPEIELLSKCIKDLLAETDSHLANDKKETRKMITLLDLLQDYANVCITYLENESLEAK